MLVFGHDRSQAVRPQLDKLWDAGFGYSFLPAGEYDRDAFIDMLNDWQWNDADRSPPDWYTGE